MEVNNGGHDLVVSLHGHLGYVLMLLPQFKGYAADFSMGKTDEQFIGVTSSLEMAQVWKKKSEARQAVVKYYLDTLRQQLGEKSKFELSINKLSRLSNGKLKDEPVEELIFEQTAQGD